MVWFDPFNILRRSWWLPILTALVAVNVSLVLSYNADAVYESQATFLVSPGNVLAQESDFDNLVDSFNPLDNRTLSITYAEILESDRIYELARQTLGLESTELDKYTRSAVVLPESSVLVLTVSGPDPQMATQIANTVGLQAIAFSSEVYEVYEVVLLDEAEVPDGPVGPSTARSVVIAGVFGVMVGAGLMLVREFLLAMGPMNSAAESLNGAQ